MKKLLLGAAAVSLMASSAHAVDVVNSTAGVSTVGAVTTVRLAEQAQNVGGNIVLDIDPTGLQFPTGNVLINLGLTGAVFDNALTGAEVTGLGACAPTSVISTGGAADTSQVTFLVSGLNTCNSPANAARITIDVDVANGSNVVSNLTLTTDAGAAVDGGTVSTNIITRTAPFSIAVRPDATPSQAAIGAPGTTPFIAFGAGSDTDIGDIDIDITTGSVVNLAGLGVMNTDVTGVGVSVTGSTSAFRTVGAAVGSVAVTEAADAATVVNATGNTGFSFASGAPAAFDIPGIIANDIAVNMNPNGVTPIEASNYAVSVALTLGGNLAGTINGTGSLQSITREGTTIVFPWTQVGATSTASGVNTVVRIANLSEGATGAVFVEVDNWSNAGFMAPAGPVQLAASIAANGELVVNGAAILAALGDYGRGDLIFTVEENANNITGRLFQVKDGALEATMPGNSFQDQN